jgi:hypothetical protein
MTILELRAAWNQMSPAERVEKLGASKAASRKTWDALSVMQQMLVSLPL